MRTMVHSNQNYTHTLVLASQSNWSNILRTKKKIKALFHTAQCCGIKGKYGTEQNKNKSCRTFKRK